MDLEQKTVKYTLNIHEPKQGRLLEITGDSEGKFPLSHRININVILLFWTLAGKIEYCVYVIIL